MSTQSRLYKLAKADAAGGMTRRLPEELGFGALPTESEQYDYI